MQCDSEYFRGREPGPVATKRDFASTSEAADVARGDGFTRSCIPPSNRLEKLRGSRKGQYSIRINDQYRVCFLWRSGDAFQVEIVDYH